MSTNTNPPSASLEERPRGLGQWINRVVVLGPILAAQWLADMRRTPVGSAASPRERYRWRMRT